MLNRKFLAAAVLLVFIAVPALSFHSSNVQNTRTPTDTVREFYKNLREKKFREAFAISIYRPAIEPLSAQEFEDLRVDFDRVATAVNEGIPAKLEITGEQISGDAASVFIKVVDADGKETIQPAALLKVDGVWIVGDRENYEIVKKAGKQFFFNARIDAHHNDVQEMLTRISLAQVVYSQQNSGVFGDLPSLIAKGLVPKDIEGTESTGYRFQITVAPDRKSWSATAVPVQYGRSGKLSFYLDGTGVRSGDAGGKPLPPVKN